MGGETTDMGLQEPCFSLFVQVEGEPLRKLSSFRLSYICVQVNDKLKGHSISNYQKHIFTVRGHAHYRSWISPNVPLISVSTSELL